MPIAQTVPPNARRPLRLWPGVIAATLLLIRLVVPVVAPAAALYAMLCGVAGALMVVVWWLFFSRAPWSERLGAIALAIVAIVAMRPLLHESIAGGMMRMMFPIYAVQSVTFALAVWAVVTRGLADGLRRASMVATILLGCGVWMLLRTDGILGGGAQLTWRWSPTSEERLLAQAADDVTAPPRSAPEPTVVSRPEPAANAGEKPAPIATAPAPAPAAAPKSAVAEWPGFRGPGRDSVIRGVRIATDWSTSPPVVLWRRPIGPGWSSFAVSGNLLYTQEQRGDDEDVSCYNITTGKPVWRHRDATRFWESNGGAGPRGTPTLSNGRVYTFGATGILNALDAATGAVAWSRNAASDTNVETPGWGFSSSPLVHNDVVVVAVSGTLAGYDAATGAPRWVGPHHGGSYSSPQLVTIDGIAQVVLLSAAGATSVAPADGKVLWEHAWPGGAIVQPAMTTDGDVLVNSIGMTGGVGVRRLAVSHAAGRWTVAERWTSSGLKPYFNDFVVHKGHAFGFDGSILSCIDLADGTRKWKGGRYGDGQLVVLPEQDLLLVLSEEGELALVSATPDQFKEIARFPAIQGKTWNHPVIVGDVLLVRNGEEMAAFRMGKAR